MTLFTNIEASLQLHEAVRIIYVVEGWKAMWYEQDNDETVVFTVHGDSIMDLMLRLEAKLSTEPFGAVKRRLR